MSKQILGGRYHILEHLGGGGFGQTYLAADQHLPGSPRCVVKRLQPRTTDGISLESARRLFNSEAEALHTLGKHDQIPFLLAHFEQDAQFYLVQEYVEGALLTEEVHPGNQLSEQQVIKLLQDLLQTLCTVHHHQVIHRDIKPSNLIRRSSDGKIVLIDFGSVKQINSQPLEQQGQVSITVAIGSLGYMPNEQLAGQPCLSSDIYAVGILALQALTGLDPRRLPKDPRTSELMWRELVAIRPIFADVLDTMVRYDFRQRYSSAKEALDALNHAVTPPGTALPSRQIDLSSEALDAHVAWLERADELFQKGRFEEAAQCYHKVIQAQPKAMTARFKLAIALETLERYEDAISAYDQIIQQQPEDYLAWVKKGKALESLNGLDQALEAYSEVLRLQPENYWTWADKGQLLVRLNRPDEALAAFNRAIQIKPDFQFAQDKRKELLITLQRVDQLYTLQHYDDAIAACDQTLEANPKDATAWFMRGMALENKEQLPEAAVAYNTVVGLQSDDYMAWFRLGGVLEKLKQFEKAAKAYSNVTHLQPENHWAWHQQGRMLEEMQNYQEAILTYQQALQIQPGFQPAQEACQRLLTQSLAPALSQFGS